ncbi:hypothetical protein CAPTEDRAFT_227277 [Capitella teleta]|uniref:THAP-type domain-containing protein n=1 Tax=Capitella teleta TaxID=283909 RepID=R7T3W4_CAPTE|nr:hypothetical protein CAPTEDRAFT_227277 [Capitella teleta]|eukprot:ELT87386.1 hypothetical protein CAPTEDRAFT_227277 [Capitella teleta]
MRDIGVISQAPGFRVLQLLRLSLLNNLILSDPEKPLLDRIEFSYALWEYECKIRQKSYLAAAGVNRDLSPSSTALKSCVIEPTAEAMQRLSPTMSTNALRRRIPALCVSLLPVNPVSRGHIRIPCDGLRITERVLLFPGKSRNGFKVRNGPMKRFMPHKCSVPGCNGNYANGPKVAVFKFPLNDEERLARWLNGIKRDNFVPTKNSRVCECHFEPHLILRESSAYDEKTGKTITCRRHKPDLVPGATPTLLPGWLSIIPFFVLVICASVLPHVKNTVEGRATAPSIISSITVSSDMQATVSLHGAPLPSVDDISLPHRISSMRDIDKLITTLHRLSAPSTPSHSDTDTAQTLLILNLGGNVVGSAYNDAKVLWSL